MKKNEDVKIWESKRPFMATIIMNIDEESGTEVTTATINKLNVIDFTKTIVDFGTNVDTNFSDLVAVYNKIENDVIFKEGKISGTPATEDMINDFNFYMKNKIAGRKMMKRALIQKIDSFLMTVAAGVAAIWLAKLVGIIH